MDDRLARDVEDLIVRVRALEGLDTPATRALAGQVADLQKGLTKINEEGATATRGEVRRLDDRITRVEHDVLTHERDLDTKAEAVQVNEMREDNKWLRRAVLTAILVAALSLGINLIIRALG